MQRKALGTLFSKYNKEKKLLACLRTGEGKSLIIKLLGTMLHGVHLIIHPILVLTADQVHSFLGCNESHGTIMAINLDDSAGTTPEHCREFVRTISEMRADTNTTTFAFASPQFLATYDHVHNALAGECC